MTAPRVIDAASVLNTVCHVVSKQSIRQQVLPETRFVEDLHFDSLELVEVFMAVEDEFGIKLPDVPTDPVYKAIFTRQPFRIADLAEIVMLQLQSGSRTQPIEWLPTLAPASPTLVPFLQGAALRELAPGEPLLEPMESIGGLHMFRRRTDGMRCIVIPEARCDIGSGSGQTDERPAHTVRLSSFIIDCEPVSVLAYCQFLNRAAVSDPVVLSDWFVPAQGDRRAEHLPVVHRDGRWQPRTPAAGHWPMIMVSWYGANAYSRWANRLDWRQYKQLHMFAPGRTTLPSEAQWEYAARGARYREFPWGSQPPLPAIAQFGLHRRQRSYTFDEIPLAPVNASLGVSPFGLLHMAGNIWQWCADSYAPDFYTTPQAQTDDPLNTADTGTRSERGGSWIGSAALLRSSYRRARDPLYRGRCLGFRCTSAVPSCLSSPAIPPCFRAIRARAEAKGP